MPEIVAETHLYLQDIITAHAFIVHLMVCVICVTSTLILNESEPTSSVNDIRADFKWDLNELTDD
jgi:hypothetical protein